MSEENLWDSLTKGAGPDDEYRAEVRLRRLGGPTVVLGKRVVIGDRALALAALEDLFEATRREAYRETDQ